MLHYFIKQKQIQKQKQVRKIFFFSTVSAIIGAVFAAFFSSKENREKLASATKKASEKIKEDSEKFYQAGSKKFNEIKKNVESKIKEKRGRGKAKKEIELEVEDVE